LTTSLWSIVKGANEKAKWNDGQEEHQQEDKHDTEVGISEQPVRAEASTQEGVD
jgi:hypothetical protein